MMLKTFRIVFLTSSKIIPTPVLCNVYSFLLSSDRKEPVSTATSNRPSSGSAVDTYAYVPSQRTASADDGEAGLVAAAAATRPSLVPALARRDPLPCACYPHQFVGGQD